MCYGCRAPSAQVRFGSFASILARPRHVRLGGNLGNAVMRFAMSRRPRLSFAGFDIALAAVERRPVGHSGRTSARRRPRRHTGRAISDRRHSLCRQIKAFQPCPIAERDFALIGADEMKQAGSMQP
jgi:hypothetical protein